MHRLSFTCLICLLTGCSQPVASPVPQATPLPAEVENSPEEAARLQTQAAAGFQQNQKP